MRAGITLSDAERRRLFERAGVDEHFGTNEAAVLLNAAPQTLRRWSCDGSGPIRPRRVNGRLRWSLADIQAVLRGECPAANAAA
jgi:hypothetical protein